jgi:hypothetical protein
MLEALGKLFDEKTGREHPLVALVDENARLSDLDLVRLVAGKIGFQNIRTFVVVRDTGKMAEIRYCAAVPISDSPPASVCSWSK